MKRSIPMTFILMSTLPMLSQAQEETNIHVGVSLAIALSIDKTQGLNFGSLQFQSNSQGGPVTLKTNGTVDLGSSGYLHSGNAQAGGFELTLTPEQEISISCSSTATAALSSDANERLLLNQIKYSVAGGADVLCSALAMSMSGITSNTLNFTIGADLNVVGGGDAVSGLFSTSHGGGSPIVFTISYK